MVYTVEYPHEKADYQIAKEHHFLGWLQLAHWVKKTKKQISEWVDKLTWEHKLSK